MNCPCCGTPLSIESLLSEESSRACVSVIAKYGMAATWVLSYLTLFSKSGHKIPWAGARIRLEEIEAVISAGKFVRKGETYIADRISVTEAMKRIVERRENLRLPLSGNALLLEILKDCKVTPVVIAPSRTVRFSRPEFLK